MFRLKTLWKHTIIRVQYAGKTNEHFFFTFSVGICICICICSFLSVGNPPIVFDYQRIIKFGMANILLPDKMERNLNGYAVKAESSLIGIQKNGNEILRYRVHIQPAAQIWHNFLRFVP